MAKELEDPAYVRAMPQTELNRLSAANAKIALKTLINDKNADSQKSIEDKLDRILDSLKTHGEERAEMQKDIRRLSDENTQMKAALLQHQRYLESLEAEKRASNLIITGVPEQNIKYKDKTASTDQEKCNLLLTVIGTPNLAINEIQRLGKPPNDPQQKRAIKVTLHDPKQRNNVLEAAKKLKDIEGQIGRIFIKKDVHPLTRKELNRLRDSAKTEKEKPENAGQDVKYDHVNREVLVNGVVVDRFQPVFFQMQGEN